MTALSRPLLASPAQPAVMLLPVMAGLFVFAAALATGVPTAMAVLLLPLAGLVVWSNTKALAGSQLFLLYGVLLGLKLLLLVYQVQNRNLPLGGVDWKYYHQFGSQAALSAGGDVPTILLTQDWDLFTRLTGALYAVFGVNSEQMYFLVFVTSLVTFTYLYKSARLFLPDPRGAVVVAMLFMAWPNEVVLSVTFLREMPIQMLVAASLYHFLRFWREGGRLHLLAALVLSLGATLMHSGLIVVPIAFAYLGIRNRNRGGIQLVRTAIFVAVIATMLQSPLAAPLLTKFGDFTDPGALLEEGFASDPAAVDATTYYLAPGMSSVPLLQLPYRLVVFALSPLPWQATNVGTAISVIIEGLPRLVLVTLLVLAFVRCRSGEPRRDVVLVGLLLALFAGYVVFSLGVSTYGSAMRHRAKFFPIEILLAYAAFAVGPWRRSRLGVRLHSLSRARIGTDA